MSNDAAGLTLLMGTTSPMLGSFTGKMAPWEPLATGRKSSTLGGEEYAEGGKEAGTGRRQAGSRLLPEGIPRNSANNVFSWVPKARASIGADGAPVSSWMQTNEKPRSVGPPNPDPRSPDPSSNGLRGQ